MSREESQITRRVRVVEFRPPRTHRPTSEPRVLIGPAKISPPAGETRREDEETRRIFKRPA